MKFLCMIGFHAWSAWAETRTGHSRRCDRCRKFQDIHE